MDSTNSSILVVDDTEEKLQELKRSLVERLPNFEIRTWQPKDDECSPEVTFDSKIDNNTAMVVTDYDLTTTIKGLFGLTIVAWCQKRCIPVGEFTRLPGASLPREPNLFELRVPIAGNSTVEYITGVVTGFSDLRTRINENPDVVTTGGSLASILANLMERPYLESQFAAYMSRPNAANSFLFESLKNETNKEDEAKDRLFTYVLGHVLLNSVLKYPGPILSFEVLCAYLAIGSESFRQVKELFEDARYTGPFSENRDLYWRDEVDLILDNLGAELDTDDQESFGDFNRKVVEEITEGKLASHECIRCNGRKGGFWCPFTNRAVCEMSDCSVPGSSWIPAGAQLCRIEREFFDEWSPILSL